MTEKMQKWVLKQNPSLWSLGLGIFGLMDALVPGPAADRLVGLITAVVAVAVWLL
jgi:hypothetical protein